MRWTMSVISVVLIGLLLQRALSTLGRASFEGTVTGALLNGGAVLCSVAAAWAVLMALPRATHE
jgi:hypothetical protein